MTLNLTYSFSVLLPKAFGGQFCSLVLGLPLPKSFVCMSIQMLKYCVNIHGDYFNVCSFSLGWVSGLFCFVVVVQDFGFVVSTTSTSSYT